jgi:hypothetical protein
LRQLLLFRDTYTDNAEEGGSWPLPPSVSNKAETSKADQHQRPSRWLCTAPGTDTVTASVTLLWWLIYDESRRLGGDTTKEVPAS